MEKGQIRFEGRTEELLARPDLLRSVFIAGTGDVAAPRAPRRRRRPRSTDGHALDVRGVDKRYGGITAVDDVDFTVEPGEIVGIIGHNGAGKTTLMDCISGFTEIDGGSHPTQRRRRHRRVAARACHRRPRTLVPGSPAVPDAHCRRDPRHRLRAPPLVAQHPGRRLAACRPRSSPRTRSRAIVDELDRADGPHAVSRQAHRRAVDRHAARRGPGVHPRPGAVGPVARRAVERCRAEGDRGARRICSSGCVERTRLRDGRDRARHAVAARRSAIAWSPSNSVA